jgi:hypothetical protein
MDGLASLLLRWQQEDYFYTLRMRVYSYPSKNRKRR